MDAARSFGKHRPVNLPRPRTLVLHLLAMMLPMASFPAVAHAESISSWNQNDFERSFEALSNWGRWGTNDQLGALNLVGPAQRRKALALAREGVSISLARDVEKDRAADNGSPFVHLMERAGANNPGFSSADAFRVSYHGMAHTHIDSLCHMFRQGRMYNGYPQTNVTLEGAAKLGIGNLKNGILARGVLIDIPSLRGVPYLEPGTPIFPADLDAWEKRSHAKVGPGDVVLVRTGRWARRAAVGPWGGKFAGLHGSCAQWLHQRDVAVLGSDAASDVLPSGVDGVDMPIHRLCIVAMGIWILDNCDLEALAGEARKRGRWEFLIQVAPLAVPGGTGSPVNPIATF